MLSQCIQSSLNKHSLNQLRVVVSCNHHAQNRGRLVAAMQEKGHKSVGEVILLKGGEAETRHDTDHEMLFR